MSKSFFNYIQPSIVRLSDDPEIPEHMRNHYLVNVNIVGIQYFVNNYLLIEDGHGGYMYMLTNDYHKIRLTDTVNSVIDIPRAYLVISEEFVQSQDDFSSWILSSIADNSFFVTGIDKFIPGVDYYINDVLYQYLLDNETEAIDGSSFDTNVVLPDYLNNKFEITKYWQELSDDTARYTDFKYFWVKNKIADLTYSEEELENFRHTFFKIIDDNAIVSEEDMLQTYNQIYKSVINYYLNGETDCALAGIALILNSQITATNSQISNCNCTGNASSNITDNNSISCFDAYKEAMAFWLKTMLGDTNFYKDWMWLTLPDGTYAPNDAMINMLITLLSDLLETDFDMSFSGKSIYNHSCGSDINEELNLSRRKIIENYITLLKWVLNGCIDNNTNKIKVIGEKFGELLPLLVF